jgi:hypothetical protein
LAQTDECKWYSSLFPFLNLDGIKDGGSATKEWVMNDDFRQGIHG